MKYICTEDESGKSEIFTFPKSVNHDCMAEVLERIKDKTDGNWTRMWRMPVSAGFVDSKGTCYGESITLGLESRGDMDTTILSNQLHLLAGT